MGLLLWALKIPLALAFTILAYLLAPVLPVFASEDGWLPKWLWYFQTEDASLDTGWKVGFFGVGKTPSRLLRYWYRVRWLTRNVGYGFDYGPLGIPFDASDWVILQSSFTPSAEVFHAIAPHKGWFSTYRHDDSVMFKLGYKTWWFIDRQTGKLTATPVGLTPPYRVPFVLEWYPWKR